MSKWEPAVINSGVEANNSDQFLQEIIEHEPGTIVTCNDNADVGDLFVDHLRAGLPCAEPIYCSGWEWAAATQRLRLQKLYRNAAVS